MGYSVVSMTALTPSQKRVLDFILSYRKAYQTLPIKREVQRALEYKSFNAVVCFFNALIKKGYLEKSDNNVKYQVTQKALDEAN